MRRGASDLLAPRNERRILVRSTRPWCADRLRPRSTVSRLVAREAPDARCETDRFCTSSGDTLLCVSNDHSAPHVLSVPIVAQHVRVLPGRYSVIAGRVATGGSHDVLVSVDIEDEQTPVTRGREDAGEWTALYTGGTAHGLDTPGMTVSLVAPLSTAGIPIFVASTSTADVVLVPAEKIDAATAALTDAGHTVE